MANFLPAEQAVTEEHLDVCAAGFAGGRHPRDASDERGHVMGGVARRGQQKPALHRHARIRCKESFEEAKAAVGVDIFGSLDKFVHGNLVRGERH